MSDDVTVIEDKIEAYADGTVASVRILSVPVGNKFESGIKYGLHYGNADAEHPFVRFDNHHGVHELHLGATTYEADFPGIETVYQAWRAALPFNKRADW